LYYNISPHACMHIILRIYNVRIMLYILLCTQMCVCLYRSALHVRPYNNLAAVRVDAEKRRVNIVVVRACVSVSLSLSLAGLFFFPDTRPANVVHSNDIIRYASHDLYTHRHTCTYLHTWPNRIPHPPPSTSGRCHHRRRWDEKNTKKPTDGDRMRARAIGAAV